MPDASLKMLAQEVGRSLCRCTADACDLLSSDLGLCRTLIRLISLGQPVSASALARASNRPQEDILAVIQNSSSIELDAQGHIVGAGLTLRPTPHRLLLAKRTLYAWCALDALMYPPLLKLDVQISSPCAASGATVSAKVSSAGLRDVTPATAVVSIVAPRGSADVRQGFCNHVHFFRSARTAQSWLAGRPDVRLISVEEAFTLAQLLVRAQPGASR